MAINLTSGAITKIMSGIYTSKDLKPVLQVTDFCSDLLRTSDDKQWYGVGLSDGSYRQIGYIACDIFISNKLQRGSIVQLTKFKFRFTELLNSKGEIISKRYVLYLYIFN